MTENLKKFLEYASKNSDAMQKLKALSNEPDRDTATRQILEIAKEANLPLSAEDFEEKTGGELSEDELASVAGGKTCVCIVGGGGESSSTDNTTNNTCACVSFGAGTAEDKNHDVWGEMPPSVGRCFCAITGYGEDVDPDW